MTASGETTAGRIVDAGQQLIMQRGYSGFSYADVSDAIDIRKASIHHHFPAKPDLAKAVVRKSREEFTAAMTALKDEGCDALTQLRGYVGHWERCISNGIAPFCVAGMLGAELPALPEDVAEEVKAHFSELAAWLEYVLAAGVRTKQFKLSADVQTEAVTFLSTVYGAMLVTRVSENPALFAVILENSVSKLTTTRK
jgi:TetR/AcrR family transcriptional regulator, transcriptional repressor for nem operon